MPTTLDTAATAELVRDLADLVCTKPDGTRWKSVSVTQMKNTCVRFCAEMARRAGGDLTLGELLTAGMVEAYCDGETENRRNVGNREIAAEDHRRTVGVGSIPPLARHVMKMLKHLDPDASTADIDVLIAHAEEQCKTLAAAANAQVPPYAALLDAAAHLGQCVGTAGASTKEISRAVYLLSMVAACPAREKMFLYMRAADSTGFDPKDAHSRAVLGALCTEHPRHADSMTLCTVLFTEGEPSTMVLGVHGCSDPRKSEYFHQLDLTVPILPVASDLLPVLHDGLKALYREYVPNTFLLRSGDGAAPFGRNWGTQLLKPTTGCTASILRKSVEQESYRLHAADAAAFPLSMCAEVCARCQHKPATAMASYVRKGLAALGGTEESEDETEPAAETEDEAAPPPRRRLVRQRAVENDCDLDLPPEEPEASDPESDGDLDLPPEEPEATSAASTGTDVALVVRTTDGGTHTFHQSVFAAAHLVDTGGRDVARADTAFDNGTLQVTWDEGDIGVFPAITDPTEAPEAPEEPEATDEPLPVDIADQIEHLLLEHGADGCVASCIALYRHKRSHRDDDTEWLEEAVRTAKKSRNC
jgi:hypothetical protein